MPVATAIINSNETPYQPKKIPSPIFNNSDKRKYETEENMLDYD